MKKRIQLCKAVLFMICMCVFSLSGCTDAERQKKEQTYDSNLEKDHSSHDVKETPDSEVESVTENWLQDTLDDISSKYYTLSIHAMSDNRLVICSEKGERIHLDLLDLSKNILYSEDLDRDITGTVEVSVMRDNIIVYDDKQHVRILDQTMHINNKITIPKKIEKRMDRAYCVLPEKKRIIYYVTEAVNGKWYCSLYSCNLKGKKGKRLVRLDGPEKNTGYINFFDSICGSVDEKKIFFCGDYFDSAESGADSKPCIGMVDIETGNLKVYKESKEFTRLMDQGMLFYDGWCEEEERTGYFTVLSQTGKKTDVQLGKKVESQQIFPSDKANYFFSVQIADTDHDDIEDTTMFRCYDHKGKQALWSRKEKTNPEQMCYFEDSCTLVYFSYNSGEENPSLKVIECGGEENE